MECRVATTFDWEWGPSALQRLSNAQALCVYIHTLHYITLRYVTLHYITYHTIPTYHTYIHTLHYIYIYIYIYFTLHYITLITYITYINTYMFFCIFFIQNLGRTSNYTAPSIFGVNYIDIGHDVLETYRLTDMKTSCPHTQDAGRIARSWSR